MIPVFADTFYFLALFSPEDRAHERAVEESRTRRAPIVTTAWVLTEFGNAFANVELRANFLRAVEHLRGNPRATIVPASDDLFGRGLELYRSRPDKEWSVTDCISFVVMEERGIQEALTGDRHFEQAGFRAVLK
ncbi:MAG: PIN domain-containing protein [Planctomycetota bacterium]|nr:PIN domain-containing protein [Planctomycetota bacterium]